MRTIGDLFLRSVQRFPRRSAFWWRGVEVTYGDLWLGAGGFARWLLEHGCRPGDRVALLLPNGPHYLIAYFGTLLARGIAVGLNPDTTAKDLAWVIGHCQPHTVLGEAASKRLIEEAVRNVRAVPRIVLTERPTVNRPPFWPQIANDEPPTPARPSPEDPAQIIYTSGTSGHPKGVTLTHRNLVANTMSIVQYLRLGPEDAVFVILPFYYSYGNSLLLTHVAVGGRLIQTPDFVFLNRALDVMAEQGATGFAGVPSSYAMLLHRSNFLDRQFPRLRYMTCAGGPLAPSIVRQLRAAFPDVELYLMYGQTEASARLSTLLPEEVDRKLGSIGRGIPGVTLRVLDDAGRPVQPGEIGEIVAQGENIMAGYWNDPDATAKVLRPEGLRTGDLATVDEEGYIYIVGRKSDLIKSGAYRIHPKEIEEVILELPGVAEVAVVGLPDELLGEAPVAFVVRSEQAPGLESDDIIRHCAQRLPRYKQVHRVVFVDTLPKTSSGKIKRSLLRTSVAAHTAG